MINARPQEDFVFPDNEETEDRYGNRPNRPNRPGSGGRPFNPDYPTNPSRPNRPVRPVRPPPNRPTPTQPPVVPDGSATRPSICETNCLTTPQYNPVCGTDMVTYNNIGRLDCAARCGKSKY